MNMAGSEPHALSDWPAEDALVLRPALDVEVRRLPASGATFLAALTARRTLEMAATLAAADPDFDLADNLAGLFAAGAPTALHFDACAESAREGSPDDRPGL
jgi:hypothetical protein